MSKFAEKLTILIDASEGLFSRLHRVENVLSNPKTRPTFLDDKAFAKVSDAFQKAFPKIPADPVKIGGYNETVSVPAQQLHDLLAPFYYAFVDLQEWHSAARDVIVEVGKGSTCLKYDVNPTLTEAFLDLVQIYMRLLFLVQKIGDRQVLLSTFCRAYFHLKYVAEPSFDRTSEFVSAYTEIIPRVQTDFRSVANQIVDAVMTLYMPFAQSCDINGLRTKGSHNLTLKPDTLSLPVEDQHLFDYMHKNKMALRIAYALLPCGEAFARVSPELVGNVLQESIHTQVYRDVSIDMVARYNIMLKNFKPKKGDVPPEVLKELQKNMTAVKKCVEQAEKFLERGDVVGVHEQRRIYLRQELSNMHSIFLDKPGLLAPKMTILLSCLANAREEILWLVRHQTAPLPKGIKLRPEDFNDKHLTDLIYLVNRLSSLVRQHLGSIREYYMEFLAGLDLRVAQKEAGSLTLPAGAKAKVVIDAILAELQSLNANSPHDFRGLRLNWFRAESWLSSTESSQFVDPIKVFLQKFTLITRHTDYADNVEKLLSDYVSLDDLWYFREGFKQAFVNATSGGTTQPMRCMVYLRLLAEFATRPNPFAPDEEEARGKACVMMGRHFLERIALCINNGLVTTAHQFAQYDDQLTEENAAYPVLKDMPTFKPAKDFVPPAIPGSESVFANRKGIEGLRQTEATVFQLCSALNEDVSIQIYDTIFTPREFVRERLMQTFKEFLFKKTVIGEGSIERPVILERRINNFCSVFMLVENYLDISVSTVFRETFLSQVYQGSLPELGAPTVGATTNPSEWEDCMVKPLVMWYTNFITQHLMSDRSAVVWSPNRKAFVSRTGNPFRAEEYVNLMELKALCRLIGPYGVKLLNIEVLKIVAAIARKLKEVAHENRPACLELQKLFAEKDADCFAAFRSFKNLDVVVALLTNIGLALHFRELLQEALGFVVQEMAPVLYSTVECAFLQYPRNTFMVEDYIACDILAFETGIRVGTADQLLKYALKDVIGSSSDDIQLWSLLPTLAAATFLSKSWAEADYRTAVEAYRTNLHCVAKSLTQLIVSFKALVSPTRNELEIQTLLEVFLEHSAILLLRASQVDPRVLQKQIGVQFGSVADVIIFLDLFLEQGLYLERDSLERVLPYALLRTMYGQVYQSRDSNPQATIRASKKQTNVDGI